MAEEAAVLEEPGTIEPAQDNIEPESTTPSPEVETAAPGSVEPEAPKAAVETAAPADGDPFAKLDEDTRRAIKWQWDRDRKSLEDKATADRERAVKDALDARERKQAEELGRLERVQVASHQVFSEMARAAGAEIDFTALTPQQQQAYLSAAGRLWDDAAKHVHQNYSDQFIPTLLKVNDEKVIAAAREKERAGDTFGHFMTLVDGYLATRDAEREAEFEKRVDAASEERVAAELKANEKERARAAAPNPPPAPGSSPSGGGLSPEQYAERLKNGQPPSASEIDEMTRRYLTA